MVDYKECFKRLSEKSIKELGTPYSRASKRYSQKKGKFGKAQRKNNV